MDEEQNQNQEQEQNGGMGDLAKKGAQMGANAVKQKAKNAILAKVGALVSTALPVIALMIGALLIMGVLMAALKWVTDLFTSKETSQLVSNMMGEYCTLDESGIHFDKSKLEEQIDKMLADEGWDKHSLGFGVSDELASKFLHNYMTASMTSQFPYIEGSDKEVQGNIYLYRDINSDGVIDSEPMEFVGPNKFSELANETDKNKKEKALKYFTIDENWNICIFKIRKTTVKSTDEITEENYELIEEDYELNEVKIPYKTMVSQFGMPFEFLMDLQLVTQNAYYVNAVANLSTSQAKIDFTIFDNIEKYTYEDIYKAKRYTKRKNPKYEEELEKYENSISENTVGGAGTGSTTPPEEYLTTSEDIYEKKVTVIETCGITANVTEAKTWILEQSTEYTYGEETTTDDSTVNNDEDNDPTPDEDQEGTWDEEKETTANIKIEEKAWNKQETYSEISPSKFMGLWQNRVGYFVENADFVSNKEGGKPVKYFTMGIVNTEDEKDVSAGSNKSYATEPILPNILTGDSYLCGLLEEKPTTQYQAEIMRELIKLYRTGEPISTYTGIEINTSVFNPTEFVEGSYVGGFVVNNEALFIKDVETLKKALAGYSTTENSKKLVENAQAFLDMQEKYKVNALFAASVSIIETSGGREGNAINGCNNWFNITGTGGPYKTTTNKFR